MAKTPSSSKPSHAFRTTILTAGNLIQPGAARHERCDEHDRHDEPDFDSVDATKPLDRERRDWRATRARPSDANEGRHRRDLQSEDGRKQRQLDPEESVVRIETQLLAAEEDPAKARGDPEQRGQPPHIVGRQLAVSSPRYRGDRQRPTSREHVSEAKSQRQHVDRREQYGNDHR